jgi:hypothetical protein
MNKRLIMFDLWRHGKNEVITPALRDLASMGPNGARAAMGLLKFADALERLGARNLCSCVQTGFPLVFYEPPISILGATARLYSAFIGEKGIHIAVARFHDKLEKDAYNANALVKAQNWAKYCRSQRGEPWLVSFEDYLNADPSADENPAWLLNLRSRARA